MEIKNSADIPPPFGRIFEHYKSFNAVQSSLLNVLLNTNMSVVLSAPTGSGKTVAFELAIVRMLLDYLHGTNSAQEHSTRVIPIKAVYVAPIKALCAERFNDWKSRFEKLDIDCVLITGDSDLDELARLRSAQVIITTPEKWDSLTRHWRDCRDVIGSIQLFLIDEVHLLNEDVRGPVLEAIVSRMHTIARDVLNKPLRFVVASATIPNVHDITCWITGIVDNRNCNNSGNKIKQGNVAELVYSDADRPVPLEKHVLGFNWSLRGFKFDMSLNYKLMDILRKYSECKATLIFCNSRKSAEMAATVLEKNITSYFALSDQQKTNLTQLAQDLHDNKLHKLIAHGIAYHHAGMSFSDRNKVEESFRQGNLMVLLCTNTLAMGVNLPARLVVIKSTEYYHLGNMTEYPESTLLQMIGRAGRPQYDTKGVAVILTHMRNVHKYETLMNGTMPIESHLHKHLAEHLNSEIALGTINNLEVAMQWMRSTYFYVRSMQNPSYYGLEENKDKDIIEHKLEKLCLVQIQELQNAGLISRSPQNELDVQTTNYGKLMAKYYLCFETMKLFRQIRGDESFLKMFDLIVRCREFSDFTLRVNEKRLLNALNDTPLRFPRPGRIKTREDKISCLLQAMLGNVPIASPTLAQESLKMLRIGDRIAKCLVEYMRLSEHQAHALHLGRYKALLHTVTIAKCFHAKLWENSEYAAKQLQKIGAVYSAQLVCAGKTTLKSLGATDARTIEAILNKSYPFGDEILQNLQQTFPEYSLQLTRDSQSLVRVCVRQVNEAYICRGINALLIVGDSENQLLLFIEDLDSLLLEYGCFMKTIKLPNPDVEQLYAHVIHATLVGADVQETLILNERVMETTIVSNSKKPKKRKQQTVVTAKCNKKVKPNLSNTINTICDTTTDSTVANKSKHLLNLKSFTFSKSKLSNDTIKLKAINVEQYVPQSKMNCEKYSYLNITDTTVNEESFNTTAKQSNNNSTLVQSKLTQYFTQRKHIKDKSFTMLTVRSADEYDTSTAVNHIQDNSEVILDRTADTTLLKYQKLLEQRDLDFDKLKESQNKQEYEQNLIANNNAPSQKMSATVEITKPGVEECAKLPVNEAEPKNEPTPIMQPSLRATTPELHELSAFLDTQKSRQSNEETQKSKNAECLEILTNGPIADCSILNGTQNYMLLNTQSSRSSTEKVQNNDPVKSTENPTLRKTPSLFLGISRNNHESSVPVKSMENPTLRKKPSLFLGISRNNDESSSFFGKPKDKTNHSFDSSVLNTRIFNCGISNMMQKEFVKSKAMPTNNEKPLDLTRKSNYSNSLYKKNAKHLKTTKSTLISQHIPNTDTVKSAKVPRAHLQYPEEDIGVLDLSRRSETNLNMSWCDSKAVDEVSAGSITLTSKSSEVPLRNSQKSIENYILCYKVATAYARLSEKERTIENFKTLYKRVWRTSSAIDYITYKLCHSSISNDEEPKTVSVQKSVIRHDPIMENSLKKSEIPLNMSKKMIVEKQVKNVLNSANVNPTAPVLRSKFTKIKNNQEKMCQKLSNRSKNQDTSSKFPNRYRLQLNEVNSEAKNAQHINNEVMHLVLNMKCNAIVAEETYQPLPDYKAIEQDVELNETQSLPSMSFEEYCSYVLQTPTK